jgi:thioredoxin 1
MMKNTVIALVLALGIGSIAAVIPTSGDDTAGVEFFHGTYDEALKKAEAEGKMVFMDAYAVWCGPCKLLNRNTFPDKALGSFLNENFVSLKMDMEKGEGPGLNNKYKVPGYPTLLFLTSTGKELNRLVGYRDAKTLLKEAKNVTSSNN